MTKMAQFCTTKAINLFAGLEPRSIASVVLSALALIPLAIVIPSIIIFRINDQKPEFDQEARLVPRVGDVRYVQINAPYIIEETANVRLLVRSFDPTILRADLAVEASVPLQILRGKLTSTENRYIRNPIHQPGCS